MIKTKRYQHTKAKEINNDVISNEWPEIGFVATESPNDPTPSIKLKNGSVVEMDGKNRSNFDSIDCFIANYGINKQTCEKAMSLSSQKIAEMLVDVHITRKELVELATGLTPAKLTEVVSIMNIVEIMMAQMKMRARKSTANQAHVTNMKDNPILIAADAAEAALRGFAEVETTCIVGRYAPFNSIALLIGSQVGRPGVISQCSMEEATELQLGIQGLTSYAETISVYGTEGVFVDGDDTPWSKAFLASAYASRGIKMRSSSGSGAEVLMGDTEGKSLLYLEARCIWVTKAAGIQGTQNGSIDGLAISSALPGGLKMVSSENLIASLLGLEVASGNDTWFTGSDMRRTAKLITAMFPGTDFITSGYSATPNEDNVFAGSNEDSNDYDDYYMIQRDYLVDGGLIPVRQKDVIRVRERAAKAMQAVFKALDFTPISDEEVEAAIVAYSSKDMPDRNSQGDLKCAELIMTEKITGIDIALILKKAGFDEEANSILELNRQKVAADYLQTGAIFDEKFNAKSSINDVNSYHGPGTGYIIDKKRSLLISKMNNVIELEKIIENAGECNSEDDIIIEEIGNFQKSHIKDEVVVAVSPSFGISQKKTLGGVSHLHVLNEIKAGLEEEGIEAKFVKCYESADLGVIANVASKLSGSGVSIGIQSKGTSVIHHKDLSPLSNLELFSQGPQLTKELYRMIGKSAAKYAKREVPTPIPSVVDPKIRRFFVKAAILHYDDTNCIVRNKPPVEFKYKGVIDCEKE